MPPGRLNEALIKYENYDDYLCFWRCLAYHYKQPSNVRRVQNDVKKLFNMFYNKEKEYNLYTGIDYAAYNKEYTQARLDADDYENTKKDELDKVELQFNININVYTNDEPDLLQIDRRSKKSTVTPNGCRSWAYWLKIGARFQNTTGRTNQACK